MPGTGDRDQARAGIPLRPHLSFPPATGTSFQLESRPLPHSQHLQPSRLARQQVPADTYRTHFMALGQCHRGPPRWFPKDGGPAWTCSQGPLVPNTTPGTRSPPRMVKSSDDKPDIPNGPLPLMVDLGAQAPSPLPGLPLPLPRSPHSSAASGIAPRQAPSLGASPGTGTRTQRDRRHVRPCRPETRPRPSMPRRGCHAERLPATRLFITHGKMVCCYENTFARYTNRSARQLP